MTCLSWLTIVVNLLISIRSVGNKYKKSNRKVYIEYSLCISMKEKGYSKEYYQKNKEYFRKKSLEWRQKNPEKYREYQNRKAREYNKQKKITVIEAYGGECACCGEKNKEFLAIDHIGGGGHQHIKKNNFRGMQFYRWLIKNGFPGGFRVLCFNCNWSIGNYGYCPHQKV